MFFGSGTTTRTCSGATPSPMQICSSRPVPALSCPPVIPVVRLSLISTTTFALAFTQSNKPVIPEWVNVLSPITAIAGCCPASAAPLAIVTDAPISTQACIAWKGDSAPKV